MIKRFNDMINENINQMEDGFYWVLCTNNNEWTIARYTSINSDGSINNYPWEFIADDRMYSDEDNVIVKIGDKIERK